MVYYSNYVTEGIVFHHSEDVDDFFFFLLTKNLDGKTFRVGVDFDDDWYCEFEMIPGAYELVKHMVMDVAFECENEDELLIELDAMIEEGFSEIVVSNDRCDCEEKCEHCTCKE